MDPYIVLSFGTALGGRRTLRVHHADTLVSSAAVSSAMVNIINSGAFVGQTGQINSIQGAAIVRTQRRIISI